MENSELVKENEQLRISQDMLKEQIVDLRRAVQEISNAKLKIGCVIQGNTLLAIQEIQETPNGLRVIVD